MRTTAILGGAGAVAILALVAAGPFSAMPVFDDLVGGSASPAPDRSGTEHLETAVPDSDIYRLLKANRSVLSQDTGTPVFRVTTNSHGLRGEPFTSRPPPNTTRILIVGDSYTYGLGVNASDRYTNIVEQQLDRDVPGDVQVINAALRGWGMRDHYTFLAERGISYRPDLVVIGLFRDDWLSRRDREELQEEVAQEMFGTPTVPQEGEARQRYLRRFGDRMEERGDRPLNTTGYRHLDDITTLTGNGTGLAVYVLDRIPERQWTFLQRWNESRPGDHLLQAPARFRDDWGDAQRLANSPYRLSPENAHPGIRGHRLLAGRLSAWLLSHPEQLDGSRNRTAG